MPDDSSCALGCDARALTVEEIGGWGRLPVRSGRVVRPERLVLPSSAGSLLPRGLGRAYGDAAVPASPESLVIETAHADRILDLAPVAGRPASECRAFRDTV